MEKPKRSYYLPTKLLKVFDAECGKGGYVKEKVVAAAICEFLGSSPNDRAAMFDKMDKFLSGKKR